MHASCGWLAVVFMRFSQAQVSNVFHFPMGGQD
jgi:hypothetical protein